jgi:putative glutamine amidotransferase
MSIKIGIAVRRLENRYIVNTDYIEGLRKAGADPIVLLPENEKDLSLRLKELKGVLIPGGYDIHPKYYNEEVDGSAGMDDSVDRMDLDLVRIAMKLGIPIFGICRGLQVINVALGGSLIQDVPTKLPESLDHMAGKHKIALNPSCKLASLFDPVILVNTHHHQAVKRIAPTLHLAAIADDGIVEALEGDGILAVQWHPERMLDEEKQLGLFKYFVELCKSKTETFD